MFSKHRSIVAVALSLFLCVGCRDASGGNVSASGAQAGSSGAAVGLPSEINPRFNARHTRKCKPVTSQPTAAQIPAIMQCNMESEDNFGVALWEDIQVQTGKTRPYQFKADGHNQDVDTEAAVLPIRGSMVYYSCRPTTDNPGHNCTRTEQSSATGTCYKTTFGDWRCFMSDSYHLTGGAIDQPPPTSH